MKTNTLIAAGILAMVVSISSVCLYAEEIEGVHAKDVMDARPDGRGNRARGLRGPSNGAPSQGNVVTGNGINYHNGPVMHSINIYFLWYGDWLQDSQANGILTHWAQNIGGSPYFNINTTYGDNTANVPNAVTFSTNTYMDPGSLGTGLTDANIATIVSNGINSGALGAAGQADPNGVYMVLTAPGVTEGSRRSNFPNSYCGWHTYGLWGSTPVMYAFIGDAAGPKLANCNGQNSSTASPNNDPGADAMVSVMAHELSETVSDPQLNAWYASNGEENADLCAWNFGSTFPSSGALANVTLGGLNYLIQQIWLNAQGGKCALSWVATPDFSLGISGSPQTVFPGGSASGSYTVTAAPLFGFSNQVAWTISPPSGITATPGSTTGSSTTFTLSAAANLKAGTYTIPVTGSYGSLTHSVNATLVVSAPTFSLSISPSSKTVSRPSSGATTVTYTVNVNAVGGFTGPVTLSGGGGATGVTPSITGTNPVAPGGTATLNVAVTSNARTGTRTLTVTGSAAGTSNKSATATITIQ